MGCSVSKETARLVASHNRTGAGNAAGNDRDCAGTRANHDSPGDRTKQTENGDGSPSHKDNSDHGLDDVGQSWHADIVAALQNDIAAVHDLTKDMVRMEVSRSDLGPRTCDGAVSNCRSLHECDFVL
jgi:hypothetical protein